MSRRILLLSGVLGLAGVYGYLLGDLVSALLLGGLLAGYLVLLDWHLEAYSPPVLLGGSLGMTLGLLVALALIHTFLRPPVSVTHPVVLVLIGTGMYLGMHVGVLLAEAGETPAFGTADADLDRERRVTGKLLDSSAVVDGRIVDVVETGFLEGPLLVPDFVLEELQTMADSSDNLKRTRGRRGLDMLNRLQNEAGTALEVVEREYPDLEEVDAKLIALAGDRNASIVTNDFNLNKVATIQGVRILNVNDLSNAVKPAYIPGETFRTEVVKEGEEPGQGVGYLDDGTMVVIEDASDALGETLDVTVTSVIQTSAGRMIFSERADGNSR